MPQKSKTKYNKKSNIQVIIDKYLGPVATLIIIGIATWLFFTRLDKLEVLTSKLNDSVIKLEATVSELDKNYSKDSETKDTFQIDYNSLKTTVKVLESEVEMLKNH